MIKDEALLNFKIECGDVAELEKLSDNLPYEFKAELSDEEALLHFLNDRVTSETRTDLQRDLEDAGILCYNPDVILMYNNGNMITDSYWIRFKSGPQSTKELQERIDKRHKVGKLPERFRTKLQKDVHYLLGKEIPGLFQICLFGSVARGDYKWDSDLDIAIVTEEPLTDHYLRGEIIDVLDDDIDGVSTDVVFRVRNRNQSLSRTFDVLFERDKVVLWQK